MKTLLVLALVVIAILLALLYFNQDKHSAEVEQLKQATIDSLARHDSLQNRLEVRIRTAEAEKSAALKRDSTSKVTYKAENDRLRAALIRARTVRVDSIIDSEPELRYYLAYYDSLSAHQSMRIDTLEIEKRVALELCDTLVFAKNKLIDAKENENQYLRIEVDKRDKLLKKKRGLWPTLKEVFKDAGFFAAGYILGKSSGG
jgi:hypothetical protein